MKSNIFSILEHNMHKGSFCWLLLLRFNATLTSKVISWRSLTHMCDLVSHTSTSTTFFQSHHLLFSHTSAGVRGENMPGRKFASAASQTRNRQFLFSHSIFKKLVQLTRKNQGLFGKGLRNINI